MSLNDIKQALKPKVKTDFTKALPEAYKEFLNLFSWEDVNKMLPHCLKVNYNIHMQSGTKPPAEPLYGISRNKLQVIKKYLENNLNNRIIQASSSPIAKPVFLSRSQKMAYNFVWTVAIQMPALLSTSNFCH